MSVYHTKETKKNKVKEEKRIHSIFEISGLANEGKLSKEKYEQLIEKSEYLYLLLSNCSSANDFDKEKYDKLMENSESSHPLSTNCSPVRALREVKNTLLNCETQFEKDFIEASIAFPEQLTILPIRLAEYNINCKELAVLNSESSLLEAERNVIKNTLSGFLSRYKMIYPDGDIIDLINILNAMYVFRTDLIQKEDNKSEETPQGKARKKM